MVYGRGLLGQTYLDRTSAEVCLVTDLYLQPCGINCQATLSYSLSFPSSPSLSHCPSSHPPTGPSLPFSIRALPPSPPTLPLPLPSPLLRPLSSPFLHPTRLLSTVPSPLSSSLPVQGKLRLLVFPECVWSAKHLWTHPRSRQW